MHIEIKKSRNRKSKKSLEKEVRKDSLFLQTWKIIAPPSLGVQSSYWKGDRLVLAFGLWDALLFSSHCSQSISRVDYLVARDTL